MQHLPNLSLINNDNNIGTLVNNLFGVNIFNPFPSFAFSSSPSSDDIFGTLVDSSLSAHLSLSLFLVVSADSSF